MGHPTVPDKGLEDKGNKLRTVVRDDTRPDVGELFSASLNNDLDICFSQGESKGYDAGKNVNGRKRHLLVDTLGLMINAYVSPANLQDRDGLKHLLDQYFEQRTTRLRKLWVDGGYRGDDLKEWVAERKHTYKIDLEVVKPKGEGFQVAKRRWVVERTFAWLFNFRRLSKDYEDLTDNSEAFIYIVMILFLPPYAPELNPVENLWAQLRQGWLANRCFEGYDAIVQA